jgi:hypothetical protein
LYALATTKLKAAPQCDDLLSRLASIKHVTESTLITQLQQTASGSRDYIYEGTNNPTELTQAKFPGVATAEVNTVGQWFDVDAGRDALSQFNGYAIFLRLDAWHSWLGGYFRGLALPTQFRPSQREPAAPPVAVSRVGRDADGNQEILRMLDRASGMFREGDGVDNNSW